MWSVIFGATNLIALAAWAILILLPRRPAAMASVLYLGIGLLCLVYTVVLVLLVSGAVDPMRDAGLPPHDMSDYSIEGLKSLFRSDGAIVLGWTHYLAFDLFVGLWIARDADAKDFSRLAQAPALLATFLAGPLGLLAWLVIRERRARALGRWT
jgi:hypothetical protein